MHVITFKILEGNIVTNAVVEEYARTEVSEREEYDKRSFFGAIKDSIFGGKTKSGKGSSLVQLPHTKEYYRNHFKTHDVAIFDKNDREMTVTADCKFGRAANRDEADILYVDPVRGTSRNSFQIKYDRETNAWRLTNYEEFRFVFVRRPGHEKERITSNFYSLAIDDEVFVGRDLTLHLKVIGIR